MKVAALALAFLGAFGMAVAAPFTVEATLPTGVGPNASALGLGGSLLVVANSDSGDISRFETATGKVLPNVAVGDVPAALALSPDGTHAHVACFRGKSVVAVDLARGIRTWSTNVRISPRDVVRVGDTVLASGYYEGEVVALDAATGAETGRLALEVGLNRILVHPDGARVYVLNTSRDALYELALGPLREVRRLGPELEYKGAWDMRMTPDGTRIVISQWVGDRVAIIGTDAFEVEGFVETGGDGACALDITPDSRHVVVTNSESDDASLIDLERRNLRAVLPTGPFPFSDVEVTADGRFALVTADNARKVAVLDLEREAVAGSIAVGRIPHVITEASDGRFYVSNVSGNSISVVRRQGPDEERFTLLHAVRY